MQRTPAELDALAADVLIIATEELHDDAPRAKRLTILADAIGHGKVNLARLLFDSLDAPLRDYVRKHASGAARWLEEGR